MQAKNKSIKEMIVFFNFCTLKANLTENWPIVETKLFKAANGQRRKNTGFLIKPQIPPISWAPSPPPFPQLEKKKWHQYSQLHGTGQGVAPVFLGHSPAVRSQTVCPAGMPQQQN